MEVAGSRSAPKILLAGRPGIGKTTVVRLALERIHPLAGGFWTEEIRAGRRRVGFRVEDIHTRQEGVLAHVDFNSGPRVGKYRVDVAAFDRVGVAALQEAMSRDGCIVIDEIGKMELCSKAFPETVLRVLDSAHPVLATMPVYQHPFLATLRQRKDIRFIEVTVQNRDRLPHEIAVRCGTSGTGGQDEHLAPDTQPLAPEA